MSTSVLERALESIDLELEPENIHADGERSPEDAEALQADLLAQRQAVEKRLRLAAALPSLDTATDVYQTHVDLTGSGVNTKIYLHYTDGANYKVGKTVVVHGRMSADDVRTVLASLDGGESFIPGQVGLPDLQDSFMDASEWNPEYDHVWHDLCEISYTDAPPTENLGAVELAGAFSRVVWDDSYRPPFYDEMTERYNERIAKDTE